MNPVFVLSVIVGQVPFLWGAALLVFIREHDAHGLVDGAGEQLVEIEVIGVERAVGAHAGDHEAEQRVLPRQGQRQHQRRVRRLVIRAAGDAAEARAGDFDLLQRARRLAGGERPAGRGHV